MKRKKHDEKTTFVIRKHGEKRRKKHGEKTREKHDEKRTFVLRKHGEKRRKKHEEKTREKHEEEKTRKKPEEEEDWGKDKLSKLPDSLVSHIFSFLPTMEAVRTMFISKRFSDTWTWIHTLSFREEIHGRFGLKVFEGKKFRDVVTQVLNSNNNPQLNMFRLKCFPSINDGKLGNVVGSWLKLLVTSKQVKSFDFEFQSQNGRPAGIVPECIFTSSSLLGLQLRFCVVQVHQLDVRLESLKTLSFWSVAIEDEAMNKIICGCPSLTELSIDDCQLLRSLVFPTLGIRKLSLDSIHIKDDCLKQIMHSCSLLEELKIVHCPSLTYFDFSTSRVRKFSLSYKFTKATKLRINCQNLRSLYLVSWQPVEMTNTSSLVDATIHITCMETLLIKSSLENVRYLTTVTMHGWIKHRQGCAEKADLSCPYKCWKSAMVSNKVEESREPWICYLLRNLPCLEDLVISTFDGPSGPILWEERHVLEEVVDVGDDPELDYLCLRKQLKRVTIEGLSTYSFSATVLLARLFLKNSWVLDELTFQGILCSLDKQEFKRKIISFPRASKHVKLNFF